MKNTAQYEDIKQHVIEQLRDGVATDQPVADAHHYIANQDYYIIGTYQAKKWLGSEAFEAIELIREYEQDNFGEVSTDFSNPEKVANMVCYILSEEILTDSDTFRGNWDDDDMTEELAATIAAEIENN